MERILGVRLGTPLNFENFLKFSNFLKYSNSLKSVGRKLVKQTVYIKKLIVANAPVPLMANTNIKIWIYLKL